MSELFNIKEKVKLRSSNWMSAEVDVVGADSTSGDILESGSIVIAADNPMFAGVLVNDTEHGERGVVIFSAEKIVLPCEALEDDVDSGSTVPYDFITGEFFPDDVENAIMIGLLLEDAKAGDEEILVYLSPMKIAASLLCIDGT